MTRFTPTSPNCKSLSTPTPPSVHVLCSFTTYILPWHPWIQEKCNELLLLAVSHSANSLLHYSSVKLGENSKSTKRPHVYPNEHRAPFNTPAFDDDHCHRLGRTESSPAALKFMGHRASPLSKQAASANERGLRFGREKIKRSVTVRVVVVVVAAPIC